LLTRPAWAGFKTVEEGRAKGGQKRLQGLLPQSKTSFAFCKLASLPERKKNNVFQLWKFYLSLCLKLHFFQSFSFAFISIFAL
jgi:hypothetical protein